MAQRPERRKPHARGTAGRALGQWRGGWRTLAEAQRLLHRAMAVPAALPRWMVPDRWPGPGSGSGHKSLGKSQAENRVARFCTLSLFLGHPAGLVNSGRLRVSTDRPEDGGTGLFTESPAQVYNYIDRPSPRRQRLLRDKADVRWINTP